MKPHIFIDPTETKKFGIRDFYHLKWILVSIGMVSIMIAIQYLQEPASLTTVGFLNTTLIENVSPTISIGSSLIVAVVISPIVEFEWMLVKEMFKR